MQRLTWAALAVAVALALPAGASADDPYEVNDSKQAATGPLVGDSNYAAEISRLPGGVGSDVQGDEDWYVFYTGQAVTIDIAYTSLHQGTHCFGPQAQLQDASGNVLAVAGPPSGETEHLRYDAPGPGQYFLLVAPYAIEPCAVPQDYKFSIGPLPAIVTPPGQTPVPPLPGGGAPKQNPRVTITSVRLRDGRLRLTGKLAKLASARRVRVYAWRTVNRRTLQFGTSGRSAGQGRWFASRLVPPRFRRFRWLRVRAVYLGDPGFFRSALRSRVVFRTPS